MPKQFIDFDGDAVDLVRDTYTQASGYQSPLMEQYRRDWLGFLAYKDMSERDPDMPNVTMPKLMSIVETKSPGTIDSLFGRRPIIPFTSKREEFEKAAEVITDVFDELLHKAGIYVEGSLLTKIKTTYGTAYMNVIPWYEKIREKSWVIDSMGMPKLQERETYRLRLKIETWAPWEILHCPFATTLMTEEGCRYVIKIQLASKRGIKKLAMKGGYPNLDLDLLDRSPSYGVHYREGHWGHKLLAAYGIAEPIEDQDMGIILRYESPERYADIWVGGGVEVELRDGGNTFAKENGGHGLINLSKISHIMPPHTQWRWYGIGEAKTNEIQIAMLNDLMNLAFRAHGLQNQPVVFFRKGKLDVDEIVFGVGRRIPVKTNDERPISDDVLIHEGRGLARDHYLLQDKVERNIDLAANQFAPGRGELTDTDNTATEIAVTEEKGSIQEEQGIKLNEHEFIDDFGRKGTSIIEMASNNADIAEIVGDERAMQVWSLNPNDLPGGYNMEFKGSGRVRQLALKQRSMRLLAPVIQGSEVKRLGGFERMILDVHDVSDKDIDKLILTDEEIAQQQQREAMLAFLEAAAGGGQITGSKPKPKGKEKESPTSTPTRQLKESTIQQVKG